ncbi:hypothetical protein [Actinomadura fibrosa]|uniref:Uncharacterized protein n=1 Tax=Actinomadura fibrosa TaxID=111802 RepID=A0ABW2XRF6_9ACTN|nr:hypothetical protein [Actinomadura fibrosa]
MTQEAGWTADAAEIFAIHCLEWVVSNEGSSVASCINALEPTLSHLRPIIQESRWDLLPYRSIAQLHDAKSILLDCFIASTEIYGDYVNPSVLDLLLRESSEADLEWWNDQRTWFRQLELRVTGVGIRRLQTIKRRRTDAPRKQSSISGALIDWLTSKPSVSETAQPRAEYAQWTDIDLFWESPHCYYEGIAVSREDAVEAARILERRGTLALQEDRIALIKKGTVIFSGYAEKVIQINNMHQGTINT